MQSPIDHPNLTLWLSKERKNQLCARNQLARENTSQGSQPERYLNSTVHITHNVSRFCLPIRILTIYHSQGQYCWYPNIGRKGHIFHYSRMRQEIRLRRIHGKLGTVEGSIEHYNSQNVFLSPNAESLRLLNPSFFGRPAGRPSGIVQSSKRSYDGTDGAD